MSGLAGCIKRLSSEYMELETNPIPFIYVRPREKDITQMDAIIMGPLETAYAAGFFHFELKFPPDYPFSPPAVRLITTDSGRVRFNPNLYASGKVCLSILGTWPGPSWTCMQSLSSVLLSIQSLMNAKPYHNEPGFEQERREGDAARYNDRIAHETLRVAVCGMMEAATCRGVFREELETEFMKHYDLYESSCVTLSQAMDGKLFQDPFNEHHGVFNYAAILKRLTVLKERVAASQAARAAAADSEAHLSDAEESDSD